MRLYNIIVASLSGLFHQQKNYYMFLYHGKMPKWHSATLNLLPANEYAHPILTIEFLFNFNNYYYFQLLCGSANDLFSKN